MSSKDLVVAFDVGGTKMIAGVVNSQGEILKQKRVLVEVEKGRQQFLDKMSDLANEMLADHPEIDVIGIASAGPLDPARGVLMSPTNLKTNGESWGEVPIVQNLVDSTNKKVLLENDAAASILAEHWLGAAKGYHNCMILTLGTGLGVGVIVNGELARAGRGLHPEGGHITINFKDETAPSGSGCFGSAEAYLSGKNFTRRVAKLWNEPDLHTKDLVDRAHKGDAKAIAVFDEYAEHMAQAINVYCVLYAPEIVLFSGGFSHAADLFMDRTKERLESLLSDRRVVVDFLPELKVSSFQEEIALLGAARVAFDNQ